MTPAAPTPFIRKRCPNPGCHARTEHAQQTIWVQFPGDRMSWLPVVGWSCSHCGNLHVEAALPVTTPADVAAGIAGASCAVGNQCGRTGCPECQA